MSKVQARDASLFSDLANTTIATQLESRLKELERNIAVARQFIKLADECYTQVRHEWELLQDVRPPRSKVEAPRLTADMEDYEQDTPKKSFKSKEKQSYLARDKNGKGSTSTSTHTPSLGAKPEAPARREAKPSNEEKAANTQKPSRGSPGSRKGQVASKE